MTYYHNGSSIYTSMYELADKFDTNINGKMLFLRGCSWVAAGEDFWFGYFLDSVSDVYFRMNLRDEICPCFVEDDDDLMLEAA